MEIDAIDVAMETIGQPHPNSPILGKFVSVTEIVKLDSIKDEFINIFEKKLGKEVTDKNILAIEKGHDSL